MANQERYWLFEVFGTDPDAIDFFGDAGLIVPSGGTGARPTIAVTGHLRFNTDTGEFEGYNGTIWQPIGSGGGGATDFVSLTDTPGSFVGYSNVTVLVSSRPYRGICAVSSR